MTPQEEMQLVVDALHEIGHPTTWQSPPAVEQVLRNKEKKARAALPHAEALATHIENLTAEKAQKQMVVDDYHRQLVEQAARIEQSESVVEAAKVADDVFENRIGFTDPSDGTVGSCLDAPDSILLDNAMEALHSALAALREDKPRPSPWTEPADHVEDKQEDQELTDAESAAEEATWD